MHPRLERLLEKNTAQQNIEKCTERGGEEEKEKEMEGQ